MKKKNAFRMAAGCCTVLFLFGVLCITAASRRASFAFTLDRFMDGAGNCGGTGVGVHEGGVVGRGENLRLEGWLLTADGIASLEYAVDDGVWTAMSAEECRIFARADLRGGALGVQGDAEHSGFSVSLPLTQYGAGVHRVFLRALTGRGDVCEFLALTELVLIGADTEDGFCTRLSFAQVPDAYMDIVPQTGHGEDVLILHDGDRVRLGQYLAQRYASAVLTYQSGDAFDAKDAALVFSLGGADYTLPLADGEAFAAGERQTTVSLADGSGRQEAFLTYHGKDPLYITDMRLYLREPLYYTGDVSVRMDTQAVRYLTGVNRCAYRASYDMAVGSFLEMTVSEETNDPFVYFPLEQYLQKERGIAVSADTYRYLVLRVRADAENRADIFRLFLCAGEVTGPTGGYSTAFTLRNDGAWHTVIVDLSGLSFWTGKIHGMRLDFLDAGDIRAGARVSLSEVTLCKDAKQAEKVAAQAPAPDPDPMQGLFAEKEFSVSARHINRFDAGVADCFSSPNDCRVQFNRYGDLCLYGTGASVDPYVSFDVRKYLQKSGLEAPDCASVGAVVLRVLGDSEIGATAFELFYYTDTHDYAEAGMSRAVTYVSDGTWQYLLFDMTDAPHFTGTLTGFRLDYSSRVGAGNETYLSDLYLFSSVSEAKKLIADRTPDGTGGESTDARTEEEETSGTAGERESARDLHGETYSDASGTADATEVPETREDTGEGNSDGQTGCGSVLRGCASVAMLLGAGIGMWCCGIRRKERGE